MKTIVVLGMHRSGTSMIAGILSHLGVNMGNDLIGERPFNPRGHFENKEFLAMNVDILLVNGGSWAKPPSREAILASGKHFDSRIEDVINRSKSSLWGWKEPRTSLTIDLYYPYLENPYFIVCYRKAEDIARSIAERAETMTQEDVPFEFSRDLTRAYNDRIKVFFKAHPKEKRLNIFYDNVIDNPEKYVRKIASFLKLKPNRAAIDFIMNPEEKKKEKKAALDEQVDKVKKLIKEHE